MSSFLIKGMSVPSHLWVVGVQYTTEASYSGDTSGKGNITGLRVPAGRGARLRRCRGGGATRAVGAAAGRGRAGESRPPAPAGPRQLVERPTAADSC